MLTSALSRLTVPTRDTRAIERTFGDAAANDTTLKGQQLLDVKSETQVHPPLSVLGGMVLQNHTHDQRGSIRSLREEGSTREPWRGYKTPRKPGGTPAKLVNPRRVTT